MDGEKGGIALWRDCGPTMSVRVGLGGHKTYRDGVVVGHDDEFVVVVDVDGDDCGGET